ncbi:phBC6A51 family helix-turn-helix protein [Calidifontibacillus erzurumensis]|uniref:Helix-turn-helix domain-containing protein n=1 Tax=Calidifontibacillus erzurumensis TaxID=2741433 RepID=A0A8J8KB98_9BACI|nr:phBC6A51 family helix-turn-helix protein [Calidifontibacillus erzurumensis]NSL51699.1 helix-turn-helix domain-containing protein [Calidifontibacillus erzurumensis]
MATLDELKMRLNDLQIRAAHLLVANSFANREDRKTKQEIADELGISRQYLWRWENNDRDFIAYKAALSDMFLESYRDLADAQLIKLIKGTSNNGIPSIKALELYYKLNGRLVNRSEVDINENINRPRLTQAEIQRGLQELEEMLKH